MAARRRNTRRRNTRRRNPVRGVGTLVLNRRRNTRRKNTARRRNGTRKGMARKTARRAYTKAKRGHRRTARRVRRAAPRARYARRRRKNTSRRRNTVARRRNTRRRNSVYMRRRRRNAVYRRTRRKNSLKIRRNKAANALYKLPVIGPLIKAIAGFAMPAVLGAVGVEPTMMLAKVAAPYIPGFSSPLFYALSGLVLAGVVGSTKFLGAAFHKKLALAIASASGGVAYYKWRLQGLEADMAGEFGHLPSYAGSLGQLGLLGDTGYAVTPMGAFVHTR